MNDCLSATYRSGREYRLTEGPAGERSRLFFSNNSQLILRGLTEGRAKTRRRYVGAIGGRNPLSSLSVISVLVVCPALNVFAKLNAMHFGNFPIICISPRLWNLQLAINE